MADHDALLVLAVRISLVAFMVGSLLDIGLVLRVLDALTCLANPRFVVRAAASRANEQWSMDFVSDTPLDGRRIRALTLVDNYTREALAIVVDSGIRGEHVVAALQGVTARRAPPRLIRVDNRPEFVSKVLDRWAYERGATLDFSRPGKPTDNGLVESFNGRLRDECLNTHRFLSLEDARTKIEAWRRDYNASRPHSALGHLTPQEFAARAAQLAFS